ncbi:MAG: glycolate oxidase subunit GlcF, partial [Mariprofundaceae bacterium]|nr:glycolate oxidase subunit GlcF [Mariprofundaceae bacterium]
MLEGHSVTRTTQQHLDRCLSCRACETTCPSGVAFAHLADIGKEMVEQYVPRPLHQRLLRTLLLAVLPHPSRFARLLAFGRLVRPLLPDHLARKIPEQQETAVFPDRPHQRKILLIEGCVQPALSPEIDAATAQVLDKLGIQTLRTGQARCCGAVEHHLNAKETALQRIRANIDAWLPCLDSGVEAIISTASACALEIREYGYLLKNDPDYADKARRISDHCRDLVELLEGENLDAFRPSHPARIAFHAPCTLQHGQQLNGRVEQLLSGLGYELTPVADAHLCCGSSGTYSILQPELSTGLRDNKLTALHAGQPELIATANIG